jgi:hypothetical protein
LGIFWRVLEWEMLVYFMTIRNIYSHLVFVAFLYGLWSFGNFSVLVCLDHEKSGNPGWTADETFNDFSLQVLNSPN